MRILSFILGIFFSISALADLPQALQEDFNDPNLEVVCHTALDRKDAIVITVDKEAVPAKENPRPENFQINVWHLEKKNGVLKILHGSPGDIQLLEKRSSNTQGGGQKSFDTWILKTHSPESNPVNHEILIVDRSVSQDDKVDLGATLVRSPLAQTARAVTGFRCPVFKLD